MKTQRAVQVFEGNGPLPRTFTLKCEQCKPTFHLSNLNEAIMTNPDADSMKLLNDLVGRVPERVSMLIYHDNGVWIVKERMVLSVIFYRQNKDQVVTLVVKIEE